MSGLDGYGRATDIHYKTGLMYPANPSATLARRQLVYDQVGNLTREQVTQQAYSAGGGSGITTGSDRSWAYSYDGLGRLTSAATGTSDTTLTNLSRMGARNGLQGVRARCVRLPGAGTPRRGAAGCECTWRAPASDLGEYRRSFRVFRMRWTAVGVQTVARVSAATRDGKASACQWPLAGRKGGKVNNCTEKSSLAVTKRPQRSLLLKSFHG